MKYLMISLISKPISYKPFFILMLFILMLCLFGCSYISPYAGTYLCSNCPSYGFGEQDQEYITLYRNGEFYGGWILAGQWQVVNGDKLLLTTPFGAETWRIQRNEIISPDGMVYIKQ